MSSHSKASLRRRRRARKSPLIVLTPTPCAFLALAKRAMTSGLILEICALARSGKPRDSPSLSRALLHLSFRSQCGSKERRVESLGKIYLLHFSSDPVILP
jgi:hypothetical protein